MICKHCGDNGAAWTCELCVADGCKKKLGKTIKGQCRTCHDELKHGIIKNQNIHLCSGSGDILSGDDPSPWQENNVRHLEDCR